MLAAALRADAYVDALVDHVDGDGHWLVVRNGHHEPRSVLTVAGAIEVHAPRVNDKRVDEASGERKRFASAILPARCRRSPKISDVLPLLYLHGLSGGDCADGSKELITLADGYRESAESWADLLRDAKRRGMRAPVLAVGDGALGFWGALREVCPETAEQRCCSTSRPAARLLRLPAEHWVHLRTTNPIESTFATVRHRTTITRGPGSKAAGLAMAFKLIIAAQDRWRAVNAPHLVALVRAGARFVNGGLVEREEDQQSAAASIEKAA